MTERNRNDSQDQSDDADAAVEDRPDNRNGRHGSAADATSRAFVLELTSGATEPGAFSGRVQHLTTFDGGNFTSAESLVAIIRRVLERAQRKQFDK